MTGPEDSPSGTRPISVAELLARNGTIGAPPVGGRRRRRRGKSDAVTVAELTGEIPIMTEGALAETGQAPEVDEDVDVTGPLPSNGATEPVEADTDHEAGADVARPTPTSRRVPSREADGADRRGRGADCRRGRRAGRGRLRRRGSRLHRAYRAARLPSRAGGFRRRVHAAPTTRMLSGAITRPPGAAPSR